MRGERRGRGGGGVGEGGERERKRKREIYYEHTGACSLSATLLNPLLFGLTRQRGGGGGRTVCPVFSFKLDEWIFDTSIRLPYI
jgi:hypothetical protein